MTMCNSPGTLFGALFAALGAVLPPIAYATSVYPDTPSRAVSVLLTVLGSLVCGGLWLAIATRLWRREPAPDAERGDTYRGSRDPRGDER